MKSILLICIVALSTQLRAQLVTFERTYGKAQNDYAYGVAQTTDEGFIVAGQTQTGPNLYDVYLVKTDNWGDTLWTSSYGGESWDDASVVLQTSDGGYVTAGTSWSIPADFGDVYLFKTDENGDSLWSKLYGGSDREEAFAMQETTDGGFILAGSTRSFGSGQYDVYIIKTDADGNLLWSKTYGGPYEDRAYGVEQTSDGGYIVAGYTGSNGPVPVLRAYLIRTDANGDSLWTKTYNDPLSSSR